MNLPAPGLKHSLKTILGMIALAIAVAGMISSASIGKAQAGKLVGQFNRSNSNVVVTNACHETVIVRNCGSE
jgi:hypothetical protein